MIKKIELSNFRNFRSRSLEFGEGTTLIIGPNASGKTNILESLYLLSTGKSFKARLEEEVIKYDRDITRINGVVGVLPLGSPKAVPPANKLGAPSLGPPASRHPHTMLEAIITRGQIDIGGDRPEKAPRKKLLVNGIPRRMIDFAGNFKVVLFGPWDMDLVTESPGIRRKFLDMVLSQIDREYRRSILSYEKGLRQRNRILLDIREGNIGRDRLLFWDQLLIKNGNYITQKRHELIEFVNSTHPLSPNSYSLTYDSSVISEGRLEHYKEEEVHAATTLVGPHRDDFVFYKADKNLASFGSRGEQRMGILWLKMAELSFVEEKCGERPTLLLDDIFSELDEEHKEIAMEIASTQQTIITSVDDSFAGGLTKVERINLEE